MAKRKTQVGMYEVHPLHKEHYKSIILDIAPSTVWRAMENGLMNMGIDVRKIRSQRLRKGGK